MKKIFTLSILFLSFLLISTQATAQCDYSLELYDSFGDGWNGASIQVTINSTPIAGSPFTFTTGSLSTVPLTGLSDGDILGLQMLGLGTFPGEVSWSLFNSEGGLTFNQSATAPLTLQNFTVVCPPCAPPNSFNVTNLLANTADLNWSPGAGLAFFMEVGLAGFTPGTGTEVASSIGVNTTESVAGLLPNTDYTFWVSSICPNGDTVSFIGPNLFTTPCATYTAPWLYDVESAATTTNGTIEDCWTNNPAGPTFNFRWNVNSGFTGSGNTGPSSAYSGANYFFTEASSGGNGAVAELTTPLVDVSALTTPAVIFYYHMYGATMGDLVTEVSTGAAWTPVDTISGQQQTDELDPWLLRIVDLTGFTGVIQVRFRGIRGTSFTGDMALDDIRIEEAPTCFPPTNLIANSITATSADLAWTTGGASTWQVEYVPAGNAQGTGTILPATTNPFTVTGLTPNTSYDFYVQDSCGVTDVSWWATGPEFRTLCATYIAPWLYTVETAALTTNGTIGDCWGSNPGGPTFTYRWNVTNTGVTGSGGTGANAAFSGTDYFYTEASSGGTGAVAELISPAVDISALTTPSLMFQYHFFGNQIDRMYIDIFDGTAWINDVDTIIGEQQLSGDDDWIFHTTDLAAFTGVIQARFRGIRGAGFRGDMCLDDIRFDDIPTCFNPTALVDSVIDPYSVSLSWVTGGASNWIIEYGIAGFTPGTGTTMATNTIPTTVTGLIPGSDYEWYVQDSCSATDLSWQSTAEDFRLPAVIFCDSSSINFTYCHPDEAIETFYYQSETGTGQLHFVFNSGQTGNFVDFSIYDGPDNTFPLLFSSTGNANMTGVEFTSNSSIVTFEYNSVFANVCTTPMDFDVNCCVATFANEVVYLCVDSTTTLADGVVVGAEGSYDAVIENVRGCDSLINYLVFILPDTTSHNDLLCVGDNYLFADGSSTNVPGSFQVTVANQNGCDSTINYTIGSISPSSSSMSAEICQGESYLMPDGVFVTTAGNFTAVLTNNAGCDSTITVSLTVNQPTTGSHNAQICNGQEFELPNGVTATTAGTYTSVITNINGCDSTVTTNLTVAVNTFSDAIVEICGNETYTLINGDEVDESGEYNISITNMAGCDSIVTVYVSKCNAIGDLDAEDILSLYPNPSVNELNITMNEALINNANFKIINAVGQIVYAQEEVTETNMKLNVSEFSNGMYFIVLSDTESTSLHKFIVAK